MAPMTTVSARLDTGVKQKAEEVLSSLGLTHSAAINALYAQIVQRRGLPFEVSLPSKADEPLSFYRIREVVRNAARRYGLKSATLFGSYARGTATSNSDIDLCVEKGNAHGFALGGFQDEVSSELGKSVDIVSRCAASGALLRHIDEDGVLLYER